MSRCLPCEKMLLNGLTATRLSNIHQMAASIPSLVAANRLKSSQADAIYGKMIAAEASFADAYNLICEEYVSSVLPEWAETGA